MKCEEIIIELPDLTDGTLSEERQALLMQHIADCETCARAYQQTKQLLDIMDADTMKLPVSTLQDQFAITMATLQQEIKPPFENNQKSAHPIFTWQNAAAACFFVLVGLGIGLFTGNHTNDQRSIRALSEELTEMKEVMALNLLKGSSTGDRLRAVTYMQTIPAPNSSVLQTLVTLLNTDNSVHVRIAAASSLENFMDEKYVTDELVNSLRLQKDPMLQILLIHMLTSQKEKAAIQPMEEILKDHQTTPEVRKIAQQSIAIL